MNHQAHKDKNPSLFKTLALADIKTLDPVTKVSTASAAAVEEAKEWVDFNEK